MSIHYNTLAFREARNLSELAALFRLRYRGYLESSCSSLVKENKFGFEIESYDWQSLHFGLFKEGRTQSRPIAYARVVQEKLSRHAPMVSQLLTLTPEMEVREPEHFSLPMLSSCDARSAIQSGLQQYRALNIPVVEASRLVFAPEARSGGSEARSFVEAAMAATFTLSDAGLIALACHPRHVPFYMRYGFKLMIDGRKNDYNGLKASIITLKKDEINPRRADGIMKLGNILKHTQAVYLPSNHAHQKETKRALAHV